jgi:hypothetical protein|tara:strand:- start:846 stop:2675 length:1830 start_codon:yes stop_codon:yes gene_type:complete
MTKKKSFVSSWFFDSSFIASANNEILADPFWVDHPKMGVVPFEDGDMGRACTKYFAECLTKYGFYNLMVNGSQFIPVQFKDGVAVEVDETYIKDFVCYALKLIPEVGVKIVDQMSVRYGWFFSKNKILTSLRPLMDMSPMTDSRSVAYRFHQNGVVKIREDEIKFHSFKELPEGRFVWSDQVLCRNFNPDLIKEFNEEEFLKDQIGNSGNHFHKWCQNLCRGRSEDDKKWVYNEEKFKSLASGYGYLLHRYWSDYKVVILVDENIQEGSSNGRTGKSVVLDDGLSNALECVTIDASEISKKGNRNNFVFNFVRPSTQYISFDDACDDFDFRVLFSKITGSLTCNAKYGGMIQFDKKDKPKMGISSNHAILGDGSSFVDRQHIVEVGDFYRFHKMNLGKNPNQFHGGWLFDEDWGSQNWEEFDAFCVKSLMYYLANDLVGGRSSENYQLKKLHQSIGSTELCNDLHGFLEENLDQKVYSHFVKGMSDVEKDLCLKEYLEEKGHTLSARRITKSLYEVAAYFGFYINGSQNIGSSSRTQVRFNGKGVNSYHISKKMFDSGASNKVSDFDPVSRLETTKVGVSSEGLLPPPVRIKEDVTKEWIKDTFKDYTL